MEIIKSIAKYFFLIYQITKFNLKVTYFKTNFYNRKISKEKLDKFIYKPSPHILSSLLSFNKKIKIENLAVNSIWDLDSKKNSEFRKLHSFFWLLVLDMKTEKKIAQSIIENWIDKNKNFNQATWKLDILSKRLIAWLSYTYLSFEDSNIKYKEKLILNITKQTNHLLNNINILESNTEKLLCNLALILVGIVFKDQKKIYDHSLTLLEKFIKDQFDESGFPKSRNLNELVINFKYLIIIREWLKESQNKIPEYLDEIILNCGNSFNFFSKNLNQLPLFNGSSGLNNTEFKEYLKQFEYNFSEKNNEKFGYTLLSDKKIILVMDVGNSPETKFSKNYQAGCLSFEITSNNEKIFCNSGPGINQSDKIKLIGKSTAAHSTLYLNNKSSCSFKMNQLIKNGLKIINKEITSEKDYFKILASHNGYQKNYGYIHERIIKFIKKDKSFFGKDNLFKKKNAKNCNFVVRFHIFPGIKTAKTQDAHTILLSLNNGEGWKFTCKNFKIMIEKGIFLGNKNKIVENENICISSLTNLKDIEIDWSLIKVS